MTFLTEEELKQFHVGGYSLSNNENGKGEYNNFLKREFLTLIQNLSIKGENTAIHLLGNALGVSIDTTDPDQLISRFNAKLNDPETQRKLLELTDGLIAISEIPLEKAGAEAASLFASTSEKFEQQGTKITWDLFEDIPGLGEFIALIKTGKDFTDTAIAGTDSFVKAGKIFTQPVLEIENKLEDASQQLANPQLPNTKIPYPNTQLTLKHGGAKAREKHYDNLKKMQFNTINRLSNTFQDFYGTRKRKRGSKKYAPRIHRTRRYRKSKR